MHPSLFIFKSTVFHLLPPLDILIPAHKCGKAFQSDQMKWYHQKHIPLKKLNFEKFHPLWVRVELKIPLLQSILPLTSSSSGESVLYFIQFQHQIYHTELLNSKINKRIKTDKRMYTYTGTGTRVQYTYTTGRHEGMWSMQTSTNIQHATEAGWKREKTQKKKQHELAKHLLYIWQATRYTLGTRTQTGTHRVATKKIKPVVRFTFGWKMFGIHFVGNGKLLYVENYMIHRLSHRSHYSMCTYDVCICV